MTLPLDRIAKELGQISTCVRTRDGREVIIDAVGTHKIYGSVDGLTRVWGISTGQCFERCQFDLIPIDPTPEPAISDDEVREALNTFYVAAPPWGNYGPLDMAGIRAVLEWRDDDITRADPDTAQGGQHG